MYIQHHQIVQITVLLCVIQGNAYSFVDRVFEQSIMIFKRQKQAGPNAEVKQYKQS